MPHFNILIIGSGITGATLALALAKATSLKIALIDAKHISPNWNNELIDQRISAVSLASKTIFHNLGCWEKICKKRVSPYTHMQVWDGESGGEIKFDCEDVNAACLGYIIEDSVMRSSLYEAFAEFNNIHLFHSVDLLDLSLEETHVEVITKNNLNFTADLLVAADGANSWVRQKANFAVTSKDYEHTAIVTTVNTEKSHEKTARQVFLKTGPLAFLPLQNPHTSSIVWSVSKERAEELLNNNDAEFSAELGKAFSYKLGKIVSVTPRLHFPLYMRHAKNYVKSRIALIGDAAHTVHPLAGLGMNMGLLDAAALSEIIADNWLKQRDFASFATLRRYERWRKSDNALVLSTINMLKSIFANENKPIQALRSFGLNITDRLVPLKNCFVNYALGKRKDLPKIAISPI